MAKYSIAIMIHGMPQMIYRKLSNTDPLRIFKSCLIMREHRRKLAFGNYLFDIDFLYNDDDYEWYNFTLGEYGKEVEKNFLIEWAKLDNPDMYTFHISQNYLKVSIPKTDIENALYELHCFVRAMLEIDNGTNDFFYYSCEDAGKFQKAKNHLANLVGWLKYKNVLIGKLKREIT